MKSKSILFLGTGKNQIPFLKAAREMGYYVIGIDRDEGSCGNCYCDETLLESIKAEEKIYKKYNSYSVIGILSEQTDNGSKSVAYLNNKFNLCGLTLEQIKIIEDKYCQRKFLTSINTLQPRYSLARKLDLTNKVDQLQIVKPRSGQSSIGVHFYQNNEKLLPNHLYEEYVDGTDYSIDGYVSDGIHFTAWCEKLKYKDSFVDKMSFAQPSPPSSVKDLVRNILEGIRAKDVFFHIEFRKKDELYYLIEIHLRGGGSGLCTHIASYVSDLDTPKLRIKMMTCRVSKQTVSFLKDRRACTVFGNMLELKSLKKKLINKFNICTGMQVLNL